jgi:transcriptional regulator with XRE-family HTH domain
MVDLEGLGYLVRDAREAKRINGKKMSQKMLGDLVGWSSASVSLFERGLYLRPQVDRLRKLAEVLEIPPGELLEKAGIKLDDVASVTLRWILDQLDEENTERLVGLGHVLLQVQLRQLQREGRKAARPSPRK